MKRLLAAALLFAVVCSGCGRKGDALSPGGSGDETGGSAEASSLSVSWDAPSEEADALLPEPDEVLPASEPETLPQTEHIPEQSIPLRSAPPGEAILPESAKEPIPEESSREEEPSAEPVVRSGYAGTLLSPSAEDDFFAPGYNPTVTAGEDIDAAVFEEELFRLINAEREARGESPLEMNERLRQAARTRSGEVFESLSHIRPDGSAYYTAFGEVDFDYAGKWHGENVSQIQFARGAYNSREAAAHMFESLRASSGHLNNMISANYGQIGIGATVEINGDNVKIGSAQLFTGL